MTFDDLGLSADVLRAVKDAGYTVPTPIQEQGIPEAIKGRDVLGIAQTGTGKTAGFVLPMLTILGQGRARARMPRSIILAPTRELAAQVSEAFETYGKHQKLTMALLIGGVSFADQVAKLDRGVDVLIATPGRLLDLTERGKVLLSGVQILVIDEADRMLDMGFIPDVERIVKLTPFTRQTLFFSATMPPEITRLTEAFLHNPVRIEVARQATTAENVTQRLVRVSEKQKREALRQILLTDDVQNGIVFCNRKRDVALLYRSLSKHGFSCCELHGDLDQRTRTATLERFRNGEVKLLIASDVAARGLDVPAVSHVFNFDVPHHPEDYVHRIGRTGRAGRSGIAYTICASSDAKSLAAIESLIAKPIPPFAIELADGGGDEDEAPARTSSRTRSRGGARKDNATEAAPAAAEPKARQPRSARTVAAKPDVQPEVISTPEPVAEAPVAASAEPARGGGRDRPQRGEQRPRRGRGNSNDQDARGGNDDVPYGRSPDVPAFLLRPVFADRPKKTASA